MNSNDSDYTEYYYTYNTMNISYTLCLKKTDLYDRLIYNFEITSSKFL